MALIKLRDEIYSVKAYSADLNEEEMIKLLKNIKRFLYETNEIISFVDDVEETAIKFLEQMLDFELTEYEDDLIIVDFDEN